MMISRDALRYLRSVNRRHVSPYICPFCLSKAAINSRRSYASVSSPRKQPLIETLSSSSTDPLPLDLSKGNVREYLKKWTQEQEKEKASQGIRIITDLNPKLSAPSSLFLRDIALLDEANQDAVQADQERDLQGGLDPFGYSEVDDCTGFQYSYLKPGDVYMVKSNAHKTQLGIHLGYIGRQSQLLLQNGTWVQTLTWEHRRCEIVSGFATPAEIAKVKALMPSTNIRPEESFDHTGLSAVGEVPPELFKIFAPKFRRLLAEWDLFRRDYAKKFEQLHDQLAEEIDYKTVSLPYIAKDLLGFDQDSAPAGMRIAFVDKITNHPGFILNRTGKQEDENVVIVLPKRVINARRIVTSWARDYQDAAARASAGRDVLPELRTNPLTQFIAKARRLISKSRKIRLFDDNSFPCPTFPDARPSHCYVEQKPTGEGFTENDKQILIVVWDTFLKVPVQSESQITVQMSVIALILRAVGAYPDRKLDASVALLFLKELGCKAPWAHAFENSVTAPMPWLGLNHAVKVAKQREERGLQALNELIATDDHSPLDRVVDVRKDWGDLPAFAIDPHLTRVVDDAFSVEPSTEHPGCTWIHVHVAHPAAFIPHHHDVLARPELMGQSVYESQYGVKGGTTPLLSFELVDRLSVSDKRSSPVLTISTLLETDGSVIDVQVTPGTLHNVSRIDNRVFARHMGDSVFLVEESESRDVYRLAVGAKVDEPSEPSEPDDAVLRRSQVVNEITANSLRIIEQHQDKFKLMDTLLRARFEARKRENPNHLRVNKNPDGFVALALDGTGDPNPSFDRIMRSEHSYGDPRVRISKVAFGEKSTATFADYPEELGVINQLKVLCAESFALWTRQRDIPVMYSIVEPLPEFPVEAMNNTGRYTPSAWPITGRSLRPGQHLFLNLKQMLPASTPLRNWMDLVNQYQVTAYFEMQSDRLNKATKQPAIYPYSKSELKRFMEISLQGTLNKNERTHTKYWTMYAFYWAYRNDPNFPKFLDVRMSTTLANHSSRVSAGHREAYLHPWPIKVMIEPSEQGYEALLKPTQFLPVKIKSISPMRNETIVTAVGPPSDHYNYPRNFLDHKSS